MSNKFVLQSFPASAIFTIFFILIGWSTSSASLVHKTVSSAPEQFAVSFLKDNTADLAFFKCRDDLKSLNGIKTANCSKAIDIINKYADLIQVTGLNSLNSEALEVILEYIVKYGKEDR